MTYTCYASSLYLPSRLFEHQIVLPGPLDNSFSPKIKMASLTSDTNKKMTYVRLGSSGLTISRIVLGCIRSYGSAQYQPWILPEEEGIARIKAAYDVGINTFDTANAYSNGLSEVILGKAIKQFNLPRDAIVVMTKVFIPVMRHPGDQWLPAMDLNGMGYVNQYGLSRKHIFDSVKHSLERLQFNYIDVLQCHRFDNDTPISETMQALHDVIKAGYVRYIGMSSCFAYQFHAMQSTLSLNELTPFISMQNHYSLIHREEEREMFPTLKMFGVGSIPWSPLARGLLTRSSEKQKASKRGDIDNWMPMYDLTGEWFETIVNRVEELATKKKISMAQITLAWIMNKDGVAAPVVGTTSLKNLYDLLGAIHVKLTPEEMSYLEEPYKSQAIIGHF
ncbi:NADP-dependent oxidoreductase domain-containing protein [Armillaria novae-zelandiae]|uniref:NADP-dependent oxidoreductase domain-containing protein n=1 Tax=Armillaria novae-zelandiae TaxID=153914 RepID=A0AA39TH74_9AGAR|nr:NADP-dependent oxidoreductase domain-containing protein [Armillaria novae-zelandiae]